MWNVIRTEEDVIRFMDDTNSLHDSCVKELYYLSGAYVDQALSMYPVNDRRTLRVIIQRQCASIPNIEMEFSGLKYLKLVPIPSDYTCEILEASLFIEDGDIYWGDCDGLSTKNLNNYGGTIICASGLRWRALP